MSCSGEVEPTSMQAYLEAHPEALENGWENLYINEAGLDDEGTSIKTIQGEQVLAIDVPNQVLLIRVKEMMFRGVLAVAKDPSRLTLQAAAQLGSIGQYAGDICEDHDGVLAITAADLSMRAGTALGACWRDTLCVTVWNTEPIWGMAISVRSCARTTGSILSMPKVRCMGTPQMRRSSGLQ